MFFFPILSVLKTIYIIGNILKMPLFLFPPFQPSLIPSLFYLLFCSFDSSPLLFYYRKNVIYVLSRFIFWYLQRVHSPFDASSLTIHRFEFPHFLKYSFVKSTNLRPYHVSKKFHSLSSNSILYRLKLC